MYAKNDQSAAAYSTDVHHTGSHRLLHGPEDAGLHRGGHEPQLPQTEGGMLKVNFKLFEGRSLMKVAVSKRVSISITIDSVHYQIIISMVALNFHNYSVLRSWNSLRDKIFFFRRLRRWPLLR